MHWYECAYSNPLARRWRFLQYLCYVYLGFDFTSGRAFRIGKVPHDVIRRGQVRLILKTVVQIRFV